MHIQTYFHVPSKVLAISLQISDILHLSLDLKSNLWLFQRKAADILMLYIQRKYRNVIFHFPSTSGIHEVKSCCVMCSSAILLQILVAMLTIS